MSVVDGGAGRSDQFVLSWQDDFDTLSAAWQLQTFTFGGNLAQFSTENASVANGYPHDEADSKSREHDRTIQWRRDAFDQDPHVRQGLGAHALRFRLGVVSGLVLFYTPFPNCNWNEIDIEHLGDSAMTSQLNAQVFLGTPTPGCTTSVSPTQDPQVVNLGANAETDFHQYDIEWTPAGVKYFVDGTLLRTWTAHIDLLQLPETILLTIWASSAASWAGPITPTSAPTSADVDWIRVYDWNG